MNIIYRYRKDVNVIPTSVYCVLIGSMRYYRSPKIITPTCHKSSKADYVKVGDEIYHICDEKQKTKVEDLTNYLLG